MCTFHFPTLLILTWWSSERLRHTNIHRHIHARACIQTHAQKTDWSMRYKVGLNFSLRRLSCLLQLSVFFFIFSVLSSCRSFISSLQEPLLFADVKIRRVWNVDKEEKKMHYLFFFLNKFHYLFLHIIMRAWKFRILVFIYVACGPEVSCIYVFIYTYWIYFGH